MLPSKRNQYIIKAAAVLFTNHIVDDDQFDIVIILDNKDISFRDLSNFLLLVDHFYGRSITENFLSYALTQRLHLKASEIREGSIEIIIPDILKPLSVSSALFFYLLVKHLGAAIKVTSEATKNFSEAFYNYEKGQLLRTSRKGLKKSLSNEEALRDLDDKELKKIIQRLQKRYQQDSKYLNKASEFARDKLKDVKVVRRKKSK